jgi:hypothetical protein
MKKLVLVALVLFALALSWGLFGQKLAAQSDSLALQSGTTCSMRLSLPHGPKAGPDIAWANVRIGSMTGNWVVCQPLDAQSAELLNVKENTSVWLNLHHVIELRNVKFFQ